MQSIIKEEPSIEEQESNAYMTSKNNSSSTNQLKRSRRESIPDKSSSRISLTCIDMAESEMFS